MAKSANKKPIQGSPFPRQRDSTQTRNAILNAAQEAFSRKGYGQVGIREIASIAGVSSSLIDRYFGSKAKLFEEALLDAMRERTILEGDKANFGKRLSRRLIDPDLDMQLLAMSVFSAGDDEAREITARITRDHIISQMAKWLGPPNAADRASQILMTATGFVMYTRQLPVNSATRFSRNWLAKTLQDIVDGVDK